MQELMTAFRFKIDSLPAFRTEFKSLLNRQVHKGELMAADEDCVFRFDLARQIFLERGL